MWFATASGLNRYDGCQMKVYRSHNLDLGPLPDNCVQKVQEDGKEKTVDTYRCRLYDL